jgi:GntR family transcriptional regulator / MocR family aminotransferase
MMDLALKLNNTSDIPLHQQLYNELRQAILSGRLQCTQRMPSSRTLAKALAISRTTVLLSYEQLISEGYLRTVPASGTFVACELPDQLLQSPVLQPVASTPQSPIELSSYGATLATVELPELPDPGIVIHFDHCGKPALDEFPIHVWKRLFSRACSLGANMLDYPFDPLGYKPLREAISRYLLQSRAVQCNPDQVIVVSGSQQALDLLARLLLNRGDRIAVEDPGYVEARHVFQAQGAEVVSVPVDEAGIVIEVLSTSAPPVKLVYVTPSHQYPTAVVLSLARRLALLAWAQESGAMILEDDYDSEFRYDERPIPALQGLTVSNSVIYIGTFSKVLFPSLRIGYIVVPQQLAPVLGRAKWLSDRQSPLLEQRALADFINEGHLESHVRRMRMLYAQRRQTLAQAINQQLGNQATIMGDNAGLNMMVQFHTHLSDEEITDRAIQRGVQMHSIQRDCIKADSRGKFLLGYASLTPEKIEEGVSRLAKVFH